MLPPLIPPRLFEEFEAGRITRAQLHAALAWHARELLVEVEEAVRDPAATWWETLLSKRYAARLIARHGIARLRHALVALSRVPDFDHARYLWNAGHHDVPLHCFFRLRRAPYFRLVSLIHREGQLRITIACGEDPKNLVEQSFLLHHSAGGLVAEPVALGE
ncbi:MAG: hypothetical protein MUF31_03335 [Akkermansiaceae bacterium]|nr:hypothetical protein [Akkermansiaceae bacterium]